MDFKYVIVQCGGEGRRLRPFTENMPKALVPVKNMPMIFHLFHRYKDKKFIIIGDYRNDELNRYLETFASVEYVSITAEHKGNIAGIKQALSYIPQNESFLLIWSDLILGSDFTTDELDEGDYVGVTKDFSCSWSFLNGILEKRSIENHGVAGCFLFCDKSSFSEIPETGSFTGWLAEKKVKLRELPMNDTVEVGTVERLRYISGMKNRCRPYNQVVINEDTVRKSALTEAAQKLLDVEIAWYRKVLEHKFPGIPRIHETGPLIMERIQGENIFSTDIDDSRKITVLKNMIKRLDELHHLETCDKDRFDIEKDYYQKTLQRVRGISAVIPFANRRVICINGKECRNPLFHLHQYRNMVEKVYRSGTNFGLIHGDCTFSNTLIDGSNNIYMIDARGYFGNRKFLGDTDYDWAKVYYSIVGAFDQFNVRNFTLKINQEDVVFSIKASGWEKYEDEFFRMIPECSPKRIRFIHAIVWLSLASHCWEDYDSMCLAFYHGVLLWNHSLEELEEN